MELPLSYHHRSGPGYSHRFLSIVGSQTGTIYPPIGFRVQVQYERPFINPFITALLKVDKKKNLRVVRGTGVLAAIDKKKTKWPKPFFVRLD